MSERRAHPRFPVNWSARILLADKSLHPAQIKNVSKGGLYFVFDQALAIGSTIGIEFFFNFRGERHRARAHAKVTNSALLSGNSGAGIGVQFLDMDKDVYHAFNNVLQELSTQE